MNKKREYSKPVIRSEKIHVGVFGDYGKVNNAISQALWQAFNGFWCCKN